MRHLKLLLAGILLICIGVAAAQNATDISPDLLAQLKKSVKDDPQTRMLINAITNNEINSLVLNREVLNGFNEVFNLQTDAKGITNQKSSGRCWLFAGLNIMRPTVMKKFNLSEFEFSQSYLFFWDKLEKTNMFLEAIIATRDKDIDDRELQAIIATPASDGGWWNYVVSLIQKYGVVPQSVFPETNNSSSSGKMDQAIETLDRQYASELRKMAAEGKSEKELRARKVEMLKSVYRMLVLHLGIPPDKFVWHFQDADKKIVEETHTPKSFYEEAVAFDLNQYVSLFDYPVYPYAATYQIDYCRNMWDMADMKFLNLPVDSLKAIALRSLQAGEPVWFAADAGWQMERKSGIMNADIYDYSALYGVSFSMSKADRLLYHVTTANHAMVLVAADVKDGKAVKWRVENSWGTDLGSKGYWTMYDNWFNEYVFTVIANKKYLSGDVTRMLDLKPKRLPAWDSMRNAF
jgi:bleomycin hydrolase